MAEDNMNDLINSVKHMVDSGNVPDNIKELLSNFSANSNTNKSSNVNNDMNNTNSSNDSSSNFSNNNEQSSNSSSDNNNDRNSNSENQNFNDFASSFDIGTIMKMKGIIDSLNKKDDPRANLLYSLKPYLRDSKKSKLDQYVNLLNMGKIADVLKKEGGL